MNTDRLAELADLLQQRSEYRDVDGLEAALASTEARIEQVEEAIATARPTTTALVIVQALLTREHIATLADPRSSEFARKRAIVALDTARLNLANALIAQDRAAVAKAIIDAYAEPVRLEARHVAA